MGNLIRSKRFWLVAPAVVYIGFFMAVPLLQMAYVSMLERGDYGGVNWGVFSMDAYISFIFERDLMDNLVVNTDYLEIFARSFGLSAMTTVFALLLGFPTAFYISTQPQSRRNFLIFLVTIPFWTNILVRNYAWMLLLRNGGLIDGALNWMGIETGGLDVLYTPYAVSIGLTYTYLPFMVLPIYASLEKLDHRLVEAAFDLGADKRRAMSRVILPLAAPGIAAGSILVFIPCLGAYVTPELLGGGKFMMIANLIGSQFGAARNWPLGAGLGFVLLALVLISMMVYSFKFKSLPEESR
ncbi:MULTISPECIES: ABC transporter permease [Thalassospira]|nr:MULTISPECIES: ABC transporter permease [Thalassospira]MBR9899292.1 ABC transporter permease [Rhodospirillales bacterium]KZB70982.1 ABC transporter permease [Thalassospira sp. MCCC 1A01148]MBC46137.1 ABC transporter permease [Thalassospira sp.]MBO6806032.1 ABC transporter permease [Thalassospira sp.]MBO6840504.1 ABC transporter permease [Thalassospira sp.]|tara:strand:+ start:320 stop:1210 length:891 start_codon:yes stop_codon:yes gene_type:complete